VCERGYLRSFKLKVECDCYSPQVIFILSEAFLEALSCLGDIWDSLIQRFPPVIVFSINEILLRVLKNSSECILNLGCLRLDLSFVLSSQRV